MKNGVSKERIGGLSASVSFLPSPPSPPLSFFDSLSISRAAKTENPIPRSFFAYPGFQRIFFLIDNEAALKQKKKPSVSIRKKYPLEPRVFFAPKPKETLATQAT